MSESQRPLLPAAAVDADPVASIAAARAPAVAASAAESHKPLEGARYGKVASRGIVFILLSSTYARLLSFVAQILLGWWLSEGDYALYGTAIACSAVVATLNDAGLSRILIQRGKEYESLASPVFQLALMFSLLAAGVLVGIAPFAASAYNAPGLPPLLYIAALAIPLNTPAMVFQARLQINLRFGLIVRIQAVSLLLQYSSMVTFAYLGFGAMSFVLPTLLVAIFDSLAYGIASNFLPNRRLLNWQLAKTLLKASAWIMVGTMAISLINVGDYLIIGRMQPAIFGIYVFGYQISAALGNMFGTGLRAVLMPTLSQVSDQPERFGRGFVHSVKLVILLTAPACIIVAMLMAPMIEFIWRGKWNAAIPVVQLFTVSLLFRMLTPMAMAALEAAGRWSLNARMLWIDAIGTITSAAIGCLIGGLVPIAACVSLNRALMAVVHCAVAGKAAGVRRRDMILAMIPAATIAGILGVAIYLIGEQLLDDLHPWLRASIEVAVFAPGYAIAAWLLMRPQLAALANVARSVMPQRIPFVSTLAGKLR